MLFDCLVVLFVLVATYFSHFSQSSILRIFASSHWCVPFGQRGPFIHLCGVPGWRPPTFNMPAEDMSGSIDQAFLHDRCQAFACLSREMSMPHVDYDQPWMRQIRVRQWNDWWLLASTRGNLQCEPREQWFLEWENVNVCHSVCLSVCL